tara:strand:- start:558 stop:1199 length:642 start_codon:yes stop_codon:yes gene_type:complete
MKRELDLAFSNLTSIFAYSTFFFLASIIFIFSIGSNLETLSRLHNAIVWVVILFGLILISENFVFEDFYDGSLRELQFLGYPGELIFITKSIVMFLVVLFPNLILVTISTILFKAKFAIILDLLLTILVASPNLVIISLLSALFSIQVKRNRFFQFIIITPFFIPTIIFATLPYNSFIGFDSEKKFFVLFGLFLITLPISLILGKLIIKEINN